MGLDRRGVMGTASSILAAAHERFGAKSLPAAIVMTHGHFDHVGALEELASRWEAPIYSHDMELPYLDGRSSYPPPDPSVGGGLMSTLSRFYPRGPIDLSRWLHVLPPDGSFPVMEGWRWIATPGHSPGHVSFWRQSDRTLIVGDAFVTTAQESAYAVATQRPEMHGTPMYYTPDWESARKSVECLARLEPELVVTGHGPAMQGPSMRTALRTLARDFEQVARAGPGTIRRRAGEGRSRRNHFGSAIFLRRRDPHASFSVQSCRGATGSSVQVPLVGMCLIVSRYVREPRKPRS
jgi:glyoxylase-like metal-dependent hydrolase (beta-lactamase superfamily II)